MSIAKNKDDASRWYSPDECGVFVSSTALTMGALVTASHIIDKRSGGHAA